jgi:hypothetical protein
MIRPRAIRRRVGWLACTTLAASFACSTSSREIAPVATTSGRSAQSQRDAWLAVWEGNDFENDDETAARVLREFGVERKRDTRRTLAQVLSELAWASHTAAAALEDHLDDPDSCVRAAAVAGRLRVRGFDDAMVTRCSALLHDSDGETRRTMAAGIRSARHEAPAELRSVLRSCLLDPDFEVRLDALNALTAPGEGYKSFEWIAAIVAFADPDPRIRFHAVEMLEAQRAESRGPPEEVLPAIARLIDDADATPVIDVDALDSERRAMLGPDFHSHTYGEWIRSGALELLLTYGGAATPFSSQVAHALQWQDDPTSVGHAAYFLGRMGGIGSEYVGALSVVASRPPQTGRDSYDADEANWARVLAAWAADRIEGSERHASHLHQLLAALEFVPGSGTDRLAFWTQSAAEVIPCLRAALSCDDEHVRAAASYFLTRDG